MPQGRMSHGQFLTDRLGRLSRQGHRDQVGGYRMAGGITQFHDQYAVHLLRCPVSHMGGHVHRCFLLADRGEGDKLAASGHDVFFQGVGDIDRLCQDHPDIAVDAAVVIEVHAGLRLSRRCQGIVCRIDPDGQHIVVIPADVTGEVGHEAHIASVVFRDPFVVQVHLAVLHHAFKLDGHSLALAGRGQTEMAAVPADAVIDDISATMLLLQLHDMRHGHGNPSGIVGVHRLSVRYVPPEEGPVCIHVQGFPTRLWGGTSPRQHQQQPSY